MILVKIITLFLVSIYMIIGGRTVHGTSTRPYDQQRTFQFAFSGAQLCTYRRIIKHHQGSDSPFT